MRITFDFMHNLSNAKFMKVLFTSIEVILPE